MGTPDIPILLGASAGCATFLLVLGLFRKNRAGVNARVQERLGQLHRDDVPEGERSFARRALWPLVRRVSDLVARLLPSRALGSIRQTLEVAGRPMSANRFLTVILVTGGVIPMMAALLTVVGTGRLTGSGLLVFSLGAAAGIYLPWTWLRRRAQQRVKSTERDLPDAIDLIITNVEAGLGLQAALLMVSEKYAGPVGEAFGRVVRDVSVGGDRKEALVAMAHRSGVGGMRLFARAVAQSEQTGIPIARVLRNHSAEIREKRQQRAREQAAKVPVKITIPTVLVMFPTLFLLILGPVALDVLERFG